MNKILSLIGGAVFLAGCTVYTPSVDIPDVRVVQPVRVVVPYDDEHKHNHDHKDKHKHRKCPPGLEKQGRC